MALLLGAIGCMASLPYSVSSAPREIRIRMASRAEGIHSSTNPGAWEEARFIGVATGIAAALGLSISYLPALRRETNRSADVLGVTIVARYSRPVG